METCPACDHEFRTSDRSTRFEAEENARLRSEIEGLRARAELEGRQTRHDTSRSSRVRLELLKLIPFPHLRERLDAELADQNARLGAHVRQLERELAEAVESLRAIRRANGNESYGDFELIWQQADLVLELHDEETRIVPVDNSI